MKKKRLNFLCWNCDREYSMLREIEGKPELIVACPFCEKEAVVDLDRFRKKVTPVYRGEKDVTTSEWEDYDFPAVIPTSALS